MIHTTVHINGNPVALSTPAPPTVLDALAAAGIDPGRRGIAVAVDGEVAPRSQWAARTLPAGGRVEIVSATQGG
jgi:sulfur carrier protein